jgi:hypothetical protein
MDAAGFTGLSVQEVHAMRQDIQRQRGIFTKPRISLALAVVVLAAALIASVGVTRWRAAQTDAIRAAATATASTLPQPTSVHIVRIPGNEPHFQIVPLDRTITDSSQGQHLYQTILNLPVSCGCGACAVTPEAYVLTFYRNGQAVLTARAGVCGGVDLDRGNPKDTREFRNRRGPPAFWAELAQVLGLPGSAVEPFI